MKYVTLKDEDLQKYEITYYKEGTRKHKLTAYDLDEVFEYLKILVFQSYTFSVEATTRLVFECVDDSGNTKEIS